MKIKKEALRAARLLLKGSMPNGRLDAARAGDLASRIMVERPRHYVQILEAFHRMLRLEFEKRHAVIESATALDDATRTQVISELTSKFGPDLTSEFKLTPDLLGGMRVKVGSTIWDGSVRTRLDTLRQAIGA